MVCQNCNYENSDDAVFCQNCGAPLRQPAPQETIQEQAVQPPLAGQAPAASGFEQVSAPAVVTRVTDRPAVIPPSIPAVYENSPQELTPYAPAGNKAKGGKFYWLIAGAAVAAVGLIVAVVLILINAFSAKNPLIYISDNQLLIHKNGAKNPITASSSFFKSSSYWNDITGDGNISEYLSSFIKLNKSGTRMFYIADIDTSDSSVSLYYCNTQNGKTNGSDQGTKIASGISADGYSFFTIDSKGSHALYLKDYSSDGGGKLYISDLKDENLVDRDVTGYWYEEQASKIYYLKSTGDGSSLYVRDAGLKKDAEKIDSDVSAVQSFADNGRTVYYTKSSGGEDNTYTLYSKAAGKDKVKILSDVYSLESRIENGCFYYTKAVKKDIDLSSLVDDDKADSDASMTEPVAPDISNYQTQTTDYFGDVYSTTDYNAYEAAYEQYDEEENAYYEKQQRDELRSELKSTTYTATDYDLYYMKNGKSTKITSDFGQSVYNTSNVLIYSKVDASSIKKIKIEDIYSVNDVETAYQNSVSTSSASSMSISGGSEIDAFSSSSNIVHPVVSANGKTLYCIDKSSADDNSGELLSYNISGNKLTGKKVLDHDVTSFDSFSDTSNLYYYKNTDNGSGDLYVFSGSKTAKIASDVYMGSCALYVKANALLYMTDYGSDHTGRLNLYKNNKSAKIADDVSYYFYEGKSGICYLTDYESSKGTGDLKQYVNANKSDLISSDVNAVLPMSGGDLF